MSEQQPRRVFVLTLIGLLAAGAAVLWGASRDWFAATLTREPPLPDQTFVASGHALAPALTALGLVLLAAVLAVVATGVMGRRVVAGGVIAVAVVGIWLVVDLLSRSEADRAEAVRRDGVALSDAGADVSATGAWVVIAGFALAALAAAILLYRARSLPVMGGKYSRSRRTAADPTRDAWQALDDGEDPTVGDDEARTG